MDYAIDIQLNGDHAKPNKTRVRTMENHNLNPLTDHHNPIYCLISLICKQAGVFNLNKRVVCSLFRARLVGLVETRVSSADCRPTTMDQAASRKACANRVHSILSQLDTQTLAVACELQL